METLLDVVGVGIFVIGIFWAITTVIYFLAGFLFGKDSGLSAGKSIGIGILLALLSGVWAAFLLWAGSTIWGITP